MRAVTSHRLARWSRLDERRLAWVLLALFMALALPCLALLLATEQQLQAEAREHQRGLIDDWLRQLDLDLQARIAVEEARGYADYQFLVVADPAAGAGLRPSELARFPPQAALPGLIGHFQIDASGRFSTPLLPEGSTLDARWNLSPLEWPLRQARGRQLHDLLAQNSLLPRARAAASEADDGALRDAAEQEGQAAAEPAAAKPVLRQDYLANQAGFDQLKTDADYRSAEIAAEPAAANERTRLAAKESKDQALASAARPAAAPPAGPVMPAKAPARSMLDEVAPALELPAQSLAKQELRGKRREQTVLPALQEGPVSADSQVVVGSSLPVRMFESELDPFEFSRLASGHWVLFRKVWREGQRYIQGALFDPQPWWQEALLGPWSASPWQGLASLELEWEGQPLAASGVQDSFHRGLLQTRLSAPLAALELRVRAGRLPAGPGAQWVRLSGAVVLSMLALGLLALYALGRRQIQLARQQQNFVSAVSHELKTPLTSIRMYGEMLREGWASEAKRQEYYDFIVEESERLSRLIGNVLQLARMERQELTLELKPVGVGSLIDLLRSKLAAPLRRAGFELDWQIEPTVDSIELRVDADALVQIVLNLVDNALKFAARGEPRKIELHVGLESDAVLWRVRDFGPGVPCGERERIFELFYRRGDEATRETVGSGIGLALVRQLAAAMQGRVEVADAEPGAVFCLRLPRPRAV